MSSSDFAGIVFALVAMYLVWQVLVMALETIVLLDTYPAPHARTSSRSFSPRRPG